MGETTATIDGTQQGAAVVAEAARLAAPAPTLNAPPLGIDDPNAWFRRGWKLRLTLTLIAVVFLVLFVVVPVVNVFAQALKGGVGAYVAVFRPTVNQARIDEVQAALKDSKRLPFSERRKLSKELGELLAPAERARKNWDAVRMTLGVAAVVVPMNLVFGVAAAWGVTKFRFKGRSLLVALIDLPFSVSPVISGLVFVLLFGAQGIFAGWAKSTANLRAIPLVRAIPWVVAGLIVLAIAWRVVRRAAPTVAGRWWS
jgi:sulfate transport system permease protein